MCMSGASNRGAVLPARYTNTNFKRDAAPWFVLALLFLVPLVFAPIDAKWLPGVPFLITTSRAAYCMLAARRVDVVVTVDGITLHGVFRSRHVPWDQIERFEIREPWRRTPFMLTFRPWVDQARVRLVGGSSRRIRAIQPRHGLTSATYFSIQHYGDADGTIDALNDLRARYAEHA
jgi:hypothetical protein